MIKHFIYTFWSLLVLGVCQLMITGCSEKISVDEIIQGDPVIEGFTPVSGKAGTEIKLTGEYFRDVLSATLGDVAIDIRYKVSQEEMILVVPAGAKSGKIVLKTRKKEVKSTESFTVVFPIPEMTQIPTQGELEQDVEIEGSNLDVVTAVYFNDMEATISYQSEKELVVQVPFVSENHVDIFLTYFDAEGEKKTGTKGGAFEIIKIRPELTSTMPSNVIKGEIIVLTGVNLHLIEKIVFGETEALIDSQSESMISFRVPTLDETEVVTVQAVYYAGTAVLTLSEACEVTIPKVLYYPGVELGAHRTSEGNLLNATTGIVTQVCALQEKENQKLFDMAAVVNTDNSITGVSKAVFAINGPQNTVGGLRNYWCNGSALTSANTPEGISSEGYGDFLTVTTTFLVLSESDPAQAEIIHLVKNGQMTEISPEVTPALFNGTIVTSAATVRMANMSEGLDYQSPSVFNEGHVVVFKNEFKNRIGLMEIKTINLNRTQEKTYSDQNATLIFDLYYER